MDQYELAQVIVGDGETPLRKEDGLTKKPNAASVIYGSARSNSADGFVEVYIDGVPTECATAISVIRGDSVAISLVGTRPTVAWVVGRGDQVRGYIEELEGNIETVWIYAVYASEEAQEAANQAYYAFLEAAQASMDAAQAALDAAEALAMAIKAVEDAETLAQEQEQIKNDLSIVDSLAQDALLGVAANTILIDDRIVDTIGYINETFVTNFEFEDRVFSEAEYSISTLLQQTSDALWFQIDEVLQPGLTEITDDFNNDLLERTTVYKLGAGGMTIGINDDAQQIKMSPVDGVTLAIAGVAQTVLNYTELLINTVRARQGIIIGRQDALGEYHFTRMVAPELAHNGNLSLDYKGGYD